jgi:hypothetical protein
VPAAASARVRLAPLLIVCLVLPLAGCVKPPGAPADDRIVMTITDDASGNPVLSTTNVSAAPNQLLEWRNEGAHVHQMIVDELAPYGHTYDIQPKGCNTSLCSVGELKLGLAKGETETTWHLHCKYHPGLTMTVTVRGQ